MKEPTLIAIEPVSMKMHRSLQTIQRRYSELSRSPDVHFIESVDARASRWFYPGFGAIITPMPVPGKWYDQKLRQNSKTDLFITRRFNCSLVSMKQSRFIWVTWLPIVALTFHFPREEYSNAAVTGFYYEKIATPTKRGLVTCRVSFYYLRRRFLSLLY